MATFIDYHGIDIRSPDPTGDGGLVLNNNFKELADRVAPVHSAVSDPTVNDDEVDTAGNGKFYIWSKWLNTATSDLFICIDSTAAAAVWLKKATTPQITETLYVDGNRTDNYTENGSILEPYKTVQAAIAVASGNIVINIAPGEYDNDIDLGLHVATIRGSGLNSTIFTGNMTAGDRAHSLEEFRIKNTGSLTITDSVTGYNLHLQCTVVVSGTGSFDGRNVMIVPASGAAPLTMSSTGQCILTPGYISAGGNTHAINQSAGIVVLFRSYVVNSSFTTATINSTGGILGVIDTSVANAGFGTAINMNNDGSAVSANTINGVVCSGNITCGTAHTYVEGLNFVGFGALTGTNLIYRPASRLDNDSTVVGATIKNALETLEAKDTFDTAVLFKDKIAFTQVDLDEYIDSLNDGYLDYGATTAHRFLNHVKLTDDDRKICFGIDDNSSICYNGSHLTLNPKEVGSGSINILGKMIESHTFTATTTGEEIYKITSTDSSVQTAGMNRTLVVDHTISGAKSGTADNEGVSCDMTLAANTHQVYAIAAYIAESGGNNHSLIEGMNIYLEDMGVGTLSNIIGLDIGINSTNVASGRHCGMRIRNHSGSATDVILVESAFVNGFNLSGATFSTADIVLQHGETISNLVDGTINLGGHISIPDAKNIVLDTTTGTKIGTATNQKLGFFNKTPVIQQTFTAVSDPPTQAEVVAIRDALINLGLMASS